MSGTATKRAPAKRPAKGKRVPKKAGRKTLLTPELEATILGFIKAGAYDWVAAEAAGIGSTTFYRWLNEESSPEEPYRAFRENVSRARAEARVVAEAAVKREEPFRWLRFGPGRDRPGRPGWTDGHGEIQAPPVVIGIDARRLQLPDNLVRYLERGSGDDGDEVDTFDAVRSPESVRD